MTPFDKGAVARLVVQAALAFATAPHWSSYAFGALFTFDAVAWAVIRIQTRRQRERQELITEAADWVMNFQWFLMAVHRGDWAEAQYTHLMAVK